MTFEVLSTEEYKIRKGYPPLTLSITVEKEIYNSLIKLLIENMFGSLTIPDTYSSFRRIRLDFVTTDEFFIFTSDKDIDRSLIVPAFSAKAYLIKLQRESDDNFVEFTISTESDGLITIL